MRHLDSSLSSFVSVEMSALADNIDFDPQILFSKKSEVNVQRFLKDDRGKLIVNEEVHNIMHRFRRIAHRRGYKRVLIAGAFGFGKSMISGTYVLLHDCTMKKVDDIKVGDLVMGPDGKPRKVLFLGRGIEQAYKITLSNGDFFECNESHKLALKVMRNFYGYKKGEKIILLLKEYLKLPEWVKLRCLQMYKVPLDFKEKEIPIDPYIYGSKIGNFRSKHKNVNTKLYKMWAGIKSRCNNPNCVGYKDYGGRGITYDPNWEDFLSFKKDMYIKYLYAKKQLKIKNISIERINVNGHYCFENCIFIERKNQGKNTRKTLNNQNILDVDLEYFNNTLDYKKFYDNFDKLYLCNSRKIRLEVLSGFLDIHGTKPSNKSKNYKVKIKDNIKLRDDLLFLCRSLGFSVSWTKCFCSKNTFSYSIVISGNINEIPCRINKINFKFKKQKTRNSNLEYTFKVESVGEKEYFGFGVDKDHLFLHHDFTVLVNTENICIGLVLEQIARNPNMFIKIVHISEKEAINRVRAIADYIKNDKDYQSFAPNVKPTSIWGQEKFIVKRDTISQNPTVAAYGVLASGLGGRAHMIIFDDINDLKSAVLEPTTRENVEQMVRTTWNTRLIPNNSECIVLLNRWHENDFINYVMHNPMWAWMSIEVAENKDNLIYKDSFGKRKDLPLWSKFPKDALIGKHIEMGDRDYKRGFELKPYSDADKTFPNFEDCCKYGINPELILDDQRNWIFGAGIDFAGTKRPGTVMVVAALNKNTGIKIPVRLYALTNPSELPNKIVEAWKDFGCFFIAENNAVQEALIEMLQTTLDRSVYSRYNIKIDSFNTGKNKADPISGLPSIQKEFEKNEWMFCFPKRYGPEEGINEKDLWNRYYHEFKHMPFFRSTDLVLATWFVREGFKTYQRSESTNWIY